VCAPVCSRASASSITITSADMGEPYGQSAPRFAHHWIDCAAIIGAITFQNVARRLSGSG
jgi:hypothetical protein